MVPSNKEGYKPQWFLVPYVIAGLKFAMYSHLSHKVAEATGLQAAAGEARDWLLVAECLASQGLRGNRELRGLGTVAIDSAFSALAVEL